MLGSDDPEVAVEEKGKDPGFGGQAGGQARGSLVRGAYVRPGLGAWQGPEQPGTAGLGYLKRRNFPVVLSASRRKRHGLGFASRW